VNTDLFQYFYPTAAFIHNELQRGNLPLWNPYQMAGQPFLAQHVPGVLYPPNLALMGLLPPARALEALSLLHLVLAGFFTWLFAARLGLQPAASLAAALSYMLSGAMLWGIYMVPFLSTHAWLPAILWTLHGLTSEARPRWALGLALFLSLAFLAGHAQGFLYETQFACAYGLFGLIFMASRGSRLRVLGLASLSGLLALGLVAPQLLPTLEHTGDAVRSFEGLPFREASRTSAGPFGLLNGIFGPFGPQPRPGSIGPVRWLLTIPVLGLPLIVCGLMARRQRAQWLLLVCATVLVSLFLLGPKTPVFKLYYSLPLGNLFRNVMRVAFLYAFLTAVLIAIGIQGIKERLRGSSTKRFIPRAAAAVLVLLIGIDSYARTELGFTHPVLSAPSRGAPTELIEYLRNQPGRERVFIEKGSSLLSRSLEVKVGMMNGIFVVPDYEPAMPAFYEKYFSTSPPCRRFTRSTLSRRDTALGTGESAPCLDDFTDQPRSWRSSSISRASATTRLRAPSGPTS
jgi:hypothetical protein